MATLSDLVDNGICHEPEALEHVFTGLSLICRNLTTLLVRKLLWVLTHTSRLRYHRLPHVRQLAAQAVAYIFRQSKSTKLKAAVKSVISDCCTRRWVEPILDGAGKLLAEACAGPQNGLNSKAPEVLKLVLSQDILTPGEFRIGVKRARGPGGVGDDYNLGNAASQTVCGPMNQPSWLTADFLEVRSSEVCRRVILDLLTRSAVERASALWVCALEEVQSRLETMQSTQHTQPGHDGRFSTTGSGVPVNGSGVGQCRGVSLARSAALVAEMLEHRSGSRAIQHAEIFTILEKLITCVVTETKSEPTIQASCLPTDPEAEIVPDSMDGMANFWGWEDGCLRSTVARLALAVVAVHEKIDKFDLIAASAEPLGSVVHNAPPKAAFPFAKQLLHHPKMKQTLTFFAPHLLGALGRVIFLQGPSVLDQYGEEALLLLVQVYGGLEDVWVCTPTALLHVNEDRVHLADWLANFLSSLSARLNDQPSGSKIRKPIAATAWLALRCLPAFVEPPTRVLQVCRQFLGSLRNMSAGVPDRPSSQSAEEMAETERVVPWRQQQLSSHDISMLKNHSLRSMARVCSQHSPSSLLEMAKETLADWMANPMDFHALQAFGDILDLLKQHGFDKDSGTVDGLQFLGVDHFRQVSPVLCPLVAAQIPAFRKAALKLVCSFEHPSQSATTRPEEGQNARASRYYRVPSNAHPPISCGPDIRTIVVVVVVLVVIIYICPSPWDAF